MQQITTQPDVNLDSIEKYVLMEALTNTEMGVSFLQWLSEICKWNDSMASDWDSARRDIWVYLRDFIPLEKLPAIENEAIRKKQARIKELLRVSAETNFIEPELEGES